MSLQTQLSEAVYRYISDKSVAGVDLERELRIGMATCSGLTDQYGDQIFKKELIRYLLRTGDVAQAEQIADGEAFFYVLLARHYQNRKQNELAQSAWWKLFSIDPHHKEALTALSPGFSEDLIDPALLSSHSDLWSDIGVYSLKNVRVSGVGCVQMLGGVDHGFMLSPQIIPPYWAKIIQTEKHLKYVSCSLKQPIYFPGKSVVPFSFGWGHYGHFLVEGIARLLLLRRLEKTGVLPSSTQIIVPDNTPRWLLGILDRHLGIDIGRIVRFSPETNSVELEEGLYPSLIDIGDERIIDLLDDIDIFQEVIEKRQKIYISRSGVKSARNATPENEMALCEIADGCGYIVVRPETMAWEEQVRLFRSAAVIAGLSGSGLHNSLYCGSNVHVISVGDVGNRVQERIAQITGQKLSFLQKDLNVSRQFYVDEDTFAFALRNATH
ncbi:MULTISPECIES: glycosyltransferase family 61 protein [Agrobacterium]|uniref:glycosyltransferase family 61 protein n=1 Tax=Agrobacterium TaxID=357 RepID=UPI00277F0712|nr:glycosyltransferase family 61 protein [Agrobacterium sp. SORGH_AS_0745]MDP9758330.1 hypothetical protein [Agrobacterium tumefaciens]MDQ1219569.1 hypothetical protein [Agrobacterium sp. SORGH_AS_0745]